MHQAAHREHRRGHKKPSPAKADVRRHLLVLAVVAFAGCSGSPASASNPATEATALTVTQQLAGRNITVKGTISCDGRAPGVIDCTGTSNDRKPIAATLNATTGGANCNGTLVISVGGTPLATIPNAKCS